MRVAVIGASGRTGTQLVRTSLERGHEVVAVCRESSAAKLDTFQDHDGLTLRTAAVVSDEATLVEALEGCDAVATVLISVWRLKATDLVTSLSTATAAHDVRRLVFTAGEVTGVLEAGEAYTRRQRTMRTIGRLIVALTPYSMKDMYKASKLIHEQPEWDWTIVRAPALSDAPAAGYRLSELSEVTSAHVLPRADFAACMLDTLGNADYHRRTLTVVPANGSASSST